MTLSGTTYAVSQIVSLHLQANTSCTPWSSYIRWIVTTHKKERKKKEKRGREDGEREGFFVFVFLRVIAIAVTGHLRPSLYIHSFPTQSLRLLARATSFLFSLIFVHKISLLVSSPVLVVWIYQMFYCIICWLYAHTCITKWCMHCVHLALWTHFVLVYKCSMYKFSCIKFHSLVRAYNYVYKWCLLILFLFIIIGKDYFFIFFPFVCIIKI